MRIIFLFLFIFLSLYSQEAVNFSSKQKGLVINTSSEFSGSLKRKILKVNLAIPYDLLSFVKFNNDMYESVVDFSIYIYTKDGPLVYKEFLTDTVRTKYYVETNSNTEKVDQMHKIPLKAGSYEIMAIATLRNANRKFSNSKLLDFDDQYENKVFLSDLKVYNITEEKSSEIRNRILPRDSGKLKFVFNSSNLDSLRNLNFLIHIENEDKELVYRNLYLTQKNYINQEHSFLINKNKFNTNMFTLKISARYENQDIDSLIQRFTFEWSAIPQTQNNMTFALTRMKYILPADSLNAHLNASLLESQEYFKRFWKNISQRNTLDDGLKMMAEYFRRVQFANQNYSTYNEANGWLKDMGRIYIKFGPPDDINRQNVNDPNYRSVIVWNYYRARKSFIFIDKLGFNNFTLAPSSLDTEYQF
jgi:GWxTD domain-containing protein